MLVSSSLALLLSVAPTNSFENQTTYKDGLEVRVEALCDGETRVDTRWDMTIVVENWIGGYCDVYINIPRSSTSEEIAHLMRDAILATCESCNITPVVMSGGSTGMSVGSFYTEGCSIKKVITRKYSGKKSRPCRICGHYVKSYHNGFEETNDHLKVWKGVDSAHINSPAPGSASGITSLVLGLVDSDTDELVIDLELSVEVDATGSMREHSLTRTFPSSVPLPRVIDAIELWAVSKGYQVVPFPGDPLKIELFPEPGLTFTAAWFGANGHYEEDVILPEAQQHAPYPHEFDYDDELPSLAPFVMSAEAFLQWQ